MARFMILIHGNEARWDSMTREETQQIDDAHRVFRERVGTAVLCSGQLGPSNGALTLRSNGTGTPAATDGPYPESAEVLGGFYVVEATDRAQAASYVEGLAELKHDHTWVEIWPLVDA